MENYNKLIEELIVLDNETPWVEFKHNNYEPTMIGKDISALANSATLHDRNCAYMVWEIHDKTHEIIGTDYNLQTLKKGNQELENWLRSLLSDNADFEFHTVQMNNINVGLLIIYKAINHTVMFEKIDYIRIGSYTKKLSDYPVIQGQVWDKIRSLRFESRIALSDLQNVDIVRLLDTDSYFELKEVPRPSDVDGVVHYMIQEGAALKQDNGLYAITNLGAMLFAKNLDDFGNISRKAVRVIQYKNNSRIEMLKEETFEMGYAAGFIRLIKYIEALIPSEETITSVLREKKSTYPIIAIREIIANALIHQDFTAIGTSPLIEIFNNRIEVTNSGRPLVDVFRIIDNPPKSRNEKLASLMRRLRICEELGTGWDKVVTVCELMQLPAPKIEIYEDSTKVTLYSRCNFTDLSQHDKLWACYLHACIKYVQGEQLTNSSLRERFALKDSSSGTISRLIKDAVAQGLIKAVDPNTAPRYMKYIPVWA